MKKYNRIYFIIPWFLILLPNNQETDAYDLEKGKTYLIKIVLLATKEDKMLLFQKKI